MSKFNVFLAQFMGQVLVRSVKPNPASVKDQVVVAVACLVPRNSVPSEFFSSDRTGTGASNPLIAVAQASEVGQNIQFTAVISMAESVAIQKFGTTTVDYTEADAPVFANEVFGMNTCINVHRCCTPNPFARNQDPVLNPTTRIPVTYNDQPVYQHSELNVGTPMYTFDEIRLPNWIVVKTSTAVDTLANVTA